jgi:hypothetical protein
MNKMMIDTIGGLVIMSLGLVFSLFHKKIAHGTVAFYYKGLPVRSIEKGYQIVFLSGGVIFFVFGLLAVLHIIKFG